MRAGSKAEEQAPIIVSSEVSNTDVSEGGRMDTKVSKAAKKAERAAQRAKVAASTQAEAGNPLGSQYGDTPLYKSPAQATETYWSINSLSEEQSGQKVLLSGSVDTVRGQGKSCFIVLRQERATVQVVLFVDDKTVNKGMVKYATAIPRESFVDVYGEVHVPETPVVGCICSKVELKVHSIHCTSRAGNLPFELADAMRSEEELQREGAQFATVNQETRLDHRWIDLRTPANDAIMEIQAVVIQLFRGALVSEGFRELQLPKLVAGAGEGGAAVFPTDYFGRPICLAQSPQLHKQMALCGRKRRVFTIGPVFRAEKSFTNRHLCEFTGLDFEMAINQHYNEVMDVMDHVFVSMFKSLQNNYAEELSNIAEQYPVEPLQYLEKTPRIPFEEGIKMLQEAGFEPDPLGDLTRELERELGSLVKEKYKTDFYALYRYPLAARPFYTMPDPVDPRYSNSFDVFLRGEEIISGSQRIHDPVLLTERAKACGIPLESIQWYINCFKHGAPHHGGLGAGLERVVMLFCGLDNIRKASMFPRDPKRITP